MTENTSSRFFWTPGIIRVNIGSASVLSEISWIAPLHRRLCGHVLNNNLSLILCEYSLILCGNL